MEVQSNLHGSKNQTGNDVVDPISSAARVDTGYIGRRSREMSLSFEEVTCGQEHRHRRQASCRSRHVRPTSLGTHSIRTGDHRACTVAGLRVGRQSVFWAGRVPRLRRMLCYTSPGPARQPLGPILPLKIVGFSLRQRRLAVAELLRSG